MLIKDVIRAREPYSISPSTTVQEAAEFMAAHNIGAVCVVDDKGKLLGVFSERDVMNRVVVQRRDPSLLKVGEVTSELRAVIRCDETPRQALERMELIGSRHLPVVDKGRLIGIVSIGDIVKTQRDKYQGELDTLQAQVLGEEARRSP